MNSGEQETGQCIELDHWKHGIYGKAEEKVRYLGAELGRIIRREGREDDGKGGLHMFIQTRLAIPVFIFFSSLSPAMTILKFQSTNWFIMVYAALFVSVQIATVYHRIGQHTLVGTIAVIESVATYVDSCLQSSLPAPLIEYLSIGTFVFNLISAAGTNLMKNTPNIEILKKGLGDG